MWLHCTVDINTGVNCMTKDIIYCITCKKCPEQYIGESDWSLQERFSKHWRHIKNKLGRSCAKLKSAWDYLT